MVLSRTRSGGVNLPAETWIGPDRSFRRLVTIDEAYFEQLVAQRYKGVFGGRIYLPLKLKFWSVLGEVVPDGILLSATPPHEWFFVEVETADHDIQTHVLPQLSRMTNIELRATDLASISQGTLKMLAEIKPGIEFDFETLVDIFSKRPSFVLVIDEASAAIQRMQRTLTPRIHLIVAAPFRSDDGQHGLLVKSKLADLENRVILQVSSGQGVFGVQLLSVTEGSALLPASGPIVIRRGDERAICQVQPTGVGISVAINGNDLDRLTGAPRPRDLLICEAMLRFQVYECQEVRSDAG